MSNETGLVVLEKVNAIEVFTGPEGIEKILRDIEGKVAAFTPDTTTVKGRKEIASMAYKVSQSKTLLDSLGKELVAEWKAQSAKVDASRKVARDRLDELRDRTRQPLTEWEEAEAARIEAERLVEELRKAEEEAWDEHDLFLRQKEIEAKEAELARIEAERLAKEEAERKERERQEHEERIRKEAEGRAKREAEEAARQKILEAERKEREAKEAAERAEREKMEAARRAKEEQERAVREAEEKARLEAERKERERLEREAAERRERERLEAEARRKAADVEHRRMVNQEALAALVKVGLTETKAKEVVKAIAGGLIPRVGITY